MAGQAVPVRGASLVIAAGALWGTVAVIVRVLVKTTDPELIAFVRILLAGVVINVIFLVRKGRRPPRPNLKYSLGAAVGIALNYLLFTLGLRYTLASAGAMIVQSEVIFLALLAVLFLGESFGRKKVVGMGLALVGVALITWNGEDLGVLFASEYFAGNVIIFVAGFFWALYVFFQRKMLTGPDILVSLSPVFLISAAILFPVSVTSLGDLLALSSVELLALVYLGIVCTGFGYIALAEGMKEMSSSAAGVLTTVMPMTSVCLAVILLREVLTPYIVLGAMVDLAGVVLVIIGEAKSPT